MVNEKYSATITVHLLLDIHTQGCINAVEGWRQGGCMLGQNLLACEAGQTLVTMPLVLPEAADVLGYASASP